MKKLYRVVRRHEGDKLYEVGDTREGEDHELKHLIPSCLQEVKAEHANKAERVSRNKSEG